MVLTREDLLPDVSDLSGSHLLVLHLDHGEAADGVQEAAVAQEVDGAPLLRKLSEGLPPENAQQQHCGRSTCCEATSPPHTLGSPIVTVASSTKLATL